MKTVMVLILLAVLGALAGAGVLMLTFITLRLMKGHFTPQSHFGFEGAAWYWHFVDVVWLFLFAAIYVWAAGTPGAH